jgi:hypothetical protein
MSRADGARWTRAWMLATLVLAAGAGLVLGLALGRSEPRPSTYLEQLTALLDLRPEQVASIEALLEAEDSDIDRWLEQSLAGLRGRVAERRARTESELLSTLDAEQHARYAQLASAGASGSGR